MRSSTSTTVSYNWVGNSIRVFSRDAVRISPVWQRYGKLCPYRTELDERWYRDHRVNFVVIEEPAWAGVDRNTVELTFGKPAREYAFEGYSVLVWDRDIAPLLPGTK